MRRLTEKTAPLSRFHLMGDSLYLDVSRFGIFPELRHVRDHVPETCTTTEDAVKWHRDEIDRRNELYRITKMIIRNGEVSGRFKVSAGLVDILIDITMKGETVVYSCWGTSLQDSCPLDNMEVEFPQWLEKCREQMTAHAVAVMRKLDRATEVCAIPLDVLKPVRPAPSQYHRFDRPAAPPPPEGHDTWLNCSGHTLKAAAAMNGPIEQDRDNDR